MLTMMLAAVLTPAATAAVVLVAFRPQTVELAPVVDAVPVEGVGDHAP